MQSQYIRLLSTVWLLRCTSRAKEAEPRRDRAADAFNALQCITKVLFILIFRLRKTAQNHKYQLRTFFIVSSKHCRISSPMQSSITSLALCNNSRLRSARCGWPAIAKAYEFLVKSLAQTFVADHCRTIDRNGQTFRVKRQAIWKRKVVCFM